jgi:hypothetical protein
VVAPLRDRRDACKLFVSSPEDFSHKLDVLRSHCEVEGREYEAIRKTATYTGDVLGDPDGFMADTKR